MRKRKNDGKLFSDGVSPIESGIRCDLCGGQDFVQLYEYPIGDFWNPATVPIAFFQCSQCKLVFLYPAPLSDQLPGAGDWHKQRPMYRRMRWWKKFWEPCRRSLLGSSKFRLIKATSKIIPSGTFLDIGCGTGEMLDEAKRYYDCFGLEPSPVAAEIARQKSFPITESTLESADFPSLFDVITLDSVIEHVVSPTAALNKIHSLLKPGGIVVLLTPKFGGPASTIHGRGWNGFRHGYHTFLFSGKTLSAVLEKTGFEVLRFPKRDRPLDDILILWARKKS